MLPNFQLRQFHSWMRVNDNNLCYQEESIIYPYTYYGSFGQIGYPVMSFELKSHQKLKNTVNGLVQMIRFL